MKLNTEGIDIDKFIDYLLLNTAIYVISTEHSDGFISGNKCIIRNALEKVKCNRKEHDDNIH